MRAVTIAMWFAFCSQLLAASPEIHLLGGVSPHQRELVLVPLPDEPAQQGEIKATVRDVRANAEIASDTLTPFGRLAATQPYMRAAWNPDERYVAFNIQWTRHTRQTLIYRIAESRLTLIRLPEYWPQAERALGRRADFAGGTETPLRWLDDHTLLLRSSGTLRDETGFDVLLTVTVNGSTASIRSVTISSKT